MAPPRKPSQADGVDFPQNRRGPFLILPSVSWPFRRSSSSSSGSSISTVSYPDTTPGTSPTEGTIHRARPDALRCRHCSTEFAYASQIISKGFTGRLGRAYLVAPPQQSPPSSAANVKSRSNNLLNIKIGKVEGRALVTGWHEVADISCRVCGETVGWKYVDAKDEAQKYKVGKFILETAQTLRHASWEDSDVFVVERHQQHREQQQRQYPYQDKQRPLDGGEDEEDEEGYEDDSLNATTFTTAATSSLAVGATDYWTQKLGDTGTSVSAVEFDSDDEDECDEIFSGTWDPAIAAKRRSRRRRGTSS